jgi:hypothetical protein
MTNEATHNGTCQACGRQHAFYNGSVAKHGYTVEHGFFNGVCWGAEKAPAEHSIDLTRSTIETLTKEANKLFDAAAQYRLGREIVSYTEMKYVGRNVADADRTGHIMVTKVFAEQDEYTQRHVRTRFVQERINAAEMRTRHVEFLNQFVIPRLGQPLIDRNVVKAPKPADGKVNVKTGEIEGAFRTKAAQKSALEGIGRTYEKTRRVVMDKILETAYEARTTEQREIYDVLPFDLHNFRAKHGVQILTVFPELVHEVAEMNRLFALRNEVKARPVVKA